MQKNHLFNIFFGIGLVLTLTGLALLSNGPSRSLRFEHEYIGTWSSSIPSQNCKAVFWYYPGIFYAYSQDLKISVRVGVSEEHILLHVINESEYQSWKAHGVIVNSLVSTNLTDEQTISFTVEEETRYYFLAENTLNRTVDTSLYLEQSGFFLRYDYTYISLLPYVLVALGVILLVAFRKEFFRRVDTFLAGWTLPRPESVLEWRLGEEERSALLESYGQIKRVAKYGALSFAGIILLFLLRDLVQLFPLVTGWSAPRPEYALVIIDMVARTNISRALLITPLVAAFVAYLLFLSPRIGDLCRIAQRRLGIRDRTEKQWKISRSMFQYMKEKLFSKRFLVFCFSIFLPSAFLIWFNVSDEVFLPLFATIGMVLSIVISIVVWSSFQEACSSNDIGKFASKTFMKASTVEIAVRSFLALVFLAVVVLFVTSNYWLSVLRQFLVVPILMLRGWPESILARQQEFVYVQTISIVSLPFVTLGLLFLVIFPYIYREGRRKVVGAFGAFWLTFFTESGLAWILGEGDFGVFRPIAFVSPLLVAFVAWVAQGKYEKILKKYMHGPKP